MLIRISMLSFPLRKEKGGKFPGITQINQLSNLRYVVFTQQLSQFSVWDVDTAATVVVVGGYPGGSTELH